MLPTGARAVLMTRERGLPTELVDAELLSRSRFNPVESGGVEGPARMVDGRDDTDARDVRRAALVDAASRVGVGFTAERGPLGRDVGREMDRALGVVILRTDF